MRRLDLAPAHLDRRSFLPDPQRFHLHEDPDAGGLRLPVRVELEDLLTLRDLLLLSGLPEAPPAAVLLMLFEALRGGSPCLDLDRHSLTASLAVLVREPRAAAAEFLEALTAERYATLIARSPAADRPLVYQANSEGARLWFQRHYLLDREVQTRLRMLAKDLPEHDSLLLKLAALSPQGLSEALAPASSLDRSQALAIAMALHSELTLLSGGPGTGKTTVIGALVETMLGLGLVPSEVALAAPTGRAARRLAEALEQRAHRLDPVRAALVRAVPTSTLHALLHYHPRGGYLHNRYHPLPIRLLVVDEVSMVDLPLMAALLEAVGPGCRLVLVGDPEQLPSVGEGTIAADLFPASLAPSFGEAFLRFAGRVFPCPLELPENPSANATPQNSRDRFVRLNRSHRSIGAVQELAEAVRSGDQATILARLHSARSEALPGEDEAGVFLVHSPQPLPLLHNWLLPLHHSLTSAALAWTAGGDLASAFEALAGRRVLTLHRTTDLGCDTLNLRLSQAWRPPEWRSRRWWPGLPLLLTVNLPEHGLANGDLGLVVVDGHGLPRAAFLRGPELHLGGEALLERCVPAYAATVHKSQGSEHERVLLVLPRDHGSALLCREVLFTALTRAKRQLVLLGDPAAVALASARSLHRQRGLEPWYG